MKRSFLFAAAIVAFSFGSFTSVDGAMIWGTDASDELVGSRDVDSGIIASGEWEDDFSIFWDIEVVENGWVYSYAIDDGDKDISHLIIEVTEDYPEPLIGHNGEFLDPMLFTHAGNLEMPEDIFGVKIDHGADYISFWSDRAPVYGDFFAKSGYDPNSEEWTFAYNSGLTDHYSESYLDFIVRPDGDGTIVTPEPASMALMGIGLGAVVWARRRRRGPGNVPTDDEITEAIDER